MELMHVLRRGQKGVVDFSYIVRLGNRVCIPVVIGRMLVFAVFLSQILDSECFVVMGS